MTELLSGLMRIAWRSVGVIIERVCAEARNSLVGPGNFGGLRSENFGGPGAADAELASRHEVTVDICATLAR